MSLNVVALQGKLTADPDVRTGNSGVPYCRFAVSVFRRGKREMTGGTGNYEESYEFFDCIAFGNRAEFLGKYFTKGKDILVDGFLQQQKYTDNNGIRRKAITIVVNNVNFCGRSSDVVEDAVPAPSESVPNNAPTYTGTNSNPPERAASAPVFTNYNANDDLPF